jgi:hypothetical protein
MITFRVFESPIAKTKVIKVGWSWLAFFFTYPWLLFKGLWLDTLLLIGFDLSIEYVLSHNNEFSEVFSEGTLIIYLLAAFFCSFAFRVIAGANGNKIVARKLLNRGYIITGTYAAPSAEAALATHRRTNTSTDETTTFAELELRRKAKERIEMTEAQCREEAEIRRDYEAEIAIQKAKEAAQLWALQRVSGRK